MSLDFFCFLFFCLVLFKFGCLVVVVVCVFFVSDLIGNDVFVTFVVVFFLSVVVLFVFCLLLSHFFHLFLCLCLCSSSPSPI